MFSSLEESMHLESVWDSFAWDGLLADAGDHLGDVDEWALHNRLAYWQPINQCNKILGDVYLKDASLYMKSQGKTLHVMHANLKYES